MNRAAKMRSIEQYTHEAARGEYICSASTVGSRSLVNPARAEQSGSFSFPMKRNPRTLRLVIVTTAGGCAAVLSATTFPLDYSLSLSVSRGGSRAAGSISTAIESALWAAAATIVGTRCLQAGTMRARDTVSLSRRDSNVE